MELSGFDLNFFRHSVLPGDEAAGPAASVICFPLPQQEDLMPFSRRDFVKTSVLGAVAAGVGTRAQGEEHASREHDPQSGSYKRPIIICAHNGFNYLDDAFAFLKGGGDTLDAALKVVKGPEDDPNDTSVGLGGIPNEEGVVELDACCMHGPTRRAGSVGAVRNIKNVSLVSKAVMEHTGHVMLVGEGAERFAVAVGFPRENLLTDHSRKIWLLWKEFHSNDDWWGPGLASPHWQAPDTKPNDGKPQSELWQERYRRLEEHAAELGHRSRAAPRRHPQGAVSADRHHSLLRAERER